jgi:hypothetical protein
MPPSTPAIRPRGSSTAWSNSRRAAPWCRPSSGAAILRAFAILEQRYFGGFVPRFMWIRLLAETDGEPASAFRAHRGVNVQGQTISALDERALTGKTVVGLGTLERWVGRPVFDAILLQFVRDFKGKAPQLA